MAFEKPQNLNLLKCNACQSTGFTNWTRCKACHGMQVGFNTRNKWLYWGFPLTREYLSLEKGRALVEKIRIITAFCLGLGSFLILAFFLYRSGFFVALYLAPGLDHFTKALNSQTVFVFWLSFISFAYLWYRSIRMKDYLGEVEHYEYDFDKNRQTKLDIRDWATAGKLRKKNKKNIACSFTLEAKKAINNAYSLADKYNHPILKPIHLFYASLSFNRVGNIFIRLGFSATHIQKQLAPLFTQAGANPTDNKTEPQISDEFWQALFMAYESAYNGHQDFVSLTEMLVACVSLSEPIAEILFDMGIDSQKLANVVEWARIREKLHHQYIKFRKAAGHRSKHGMDKAMTAVATPYLDRFSDDLTIMAQFGHLYPCVSRDKIWEEMFRVVEGGSQSLILVGDYGVGKKTIVEGLAQKMVEDDVPQRLKDKRLVRLNISSLLAGTTPAGAVERLQRIMHEVGRAGNIILYIHNIHELVGVSAGSGKGSLDVSSALSQYLTSGRFLTIADTTAEFYSQLIVNSGLSNVMSKVEVPEMDVNQSICVLESRAGGMEYKHQVFFSYIAIEKAVNLAKRYLHDTNLPGNALEVMTESASLARNKKGANSIVTEDEVAQIISQKTNIPITSVSADESAKLLLLETEMHKRVIGQDEAVNSIANALRRARVEIRSTNRPIASFLFLGPTGVGKTELAKTIASIYFGGEERMIRLDMSEYQDKSGLSRLLGRSGEQGTGILTESIRQHPFSLLLLDEIEKAESDILNIFLQVMDDGRLTDSTGRVVDFTNVIVIATSNAGTAYVQDEIKNGTDFAIIKEKLMHGQLREYFRPEFLNRFDGITLFKALTLEDIKKIAGLMLVKLSKKLEEKGINMIIEPLALDYLASIGFDPEFGARPMRRALQEKIENSLAELMLSKKLNRRDTVTIGAGGELRVSNQ
ncbi:MAG: hypothetical protein COU31_03290 [Candidatus Magasanikbacteria bacterium CG10_big_fil_rev_8_21_14_0_10_40_10]|uniref:Clp R domain-containing protein n=1 Tax=Candidatus Magasanikbacteria bacterium CG10_big_fil_rev_8_21_14_0_10_40_10 TaxID=1974648 RepID=A0A2M6W3H8_9BACT|nr:MAG: hypothetical protein COU31_03290 [Candidatus Magasanikbacteria bacterium CG10_big_fil_rev_8_21_14_0_10_40_10]